MTITVFFSTMTVLWVVLDAIGCCWLWVVARVFMLIITVCAVVLLAGIREEVRTRDEIPEKSCENCEDCCCAFWCTCCATAQLARHEYGSIPNKRVEYDCGSATGVPQSFGMPTAPEEAV